MLILIVFSPDPTRLFLTFDANVRLKDKFHGNTALHWACTSGNHVAVKLLLDAGSSLDIKNDKVPVIVGFLTLVKLKPQQPGSFKS